MLAIGRALMTNPSLLILDEATEGLSPIVSEEVWTVLNKISIEGVTILIIDKLSHRLKSLSLWFYCRERSDCLDWRDD